MIAGGKVLYPFYFYKDNKIYVKLRNIIASSRFRDLLDIINLLHRFSEAYFITFPHGLIMQLHHHADSEPILTSM